MLSHLLDNRLCRTEKVFDRNTCSFRIFCSRLLIDNLVDNCSLQTIDNLPGKRNRDLIIIIKLDDQSGDLMHYSILRLNHTLLDEVRIIVANDFRGLSEQDNHGLYDAVHQFITSLYR